ncbi:MAG: TRAM domain-containing protein [Candidatus Aenigmarchaeota archaeon]|nr:TRAM domain-containing protein [Candidatus Aenigmarchaeota archaeon]MCX8190742.1 TRAM domain-containing protein [Candidatus Aenigmarchaeota archaeon]MDW8159990.1 TRAM domain-containing protein [Candidatus Aenigmarchaeota archaeon]
MFKGKGFNKKFNLDFPKPVKEGEEYDVEITETGSRGDGIARIKNFVIFVPGVQKGEKKRIKIVRVARKFAIGEVKETVDKTSTESKGETV